MSDARCLACSMEGCGRYSPPCTCSCHGNPDPVKQLREVINAGAARFDARPIERASVEARRELRSAHVLHSEEDHTCGCTERCITVDHCSACSAPQFVGPDGEHYCGSAAFVLVAYARAEARYRAALETISRADTFARHGAAHAQVARCTRIARAALAGEDPAE